MTGCDEERERIAREIQARVIRFKPTPHAQAENEAKQKAYRQRRQAWHRDHPPCAALPDNSMDTAPGEAKSISALLL